MPMNLSDSNKDDSAGAGMSLGSKMYLEKIGEGRIRGNESSGGYQGGGGADPFAMALFALAVIFPIPAAIIGSTIVAGVILKRRSNNKKNLKDASGNILPKLHPLPGNTKTNFEREESYNGGYEYRVYSEGEVNKIMGRRGKVQASKSNADKYYEKKEWKYVSSWKKEESRLYENIKHLTGDQAFDEIQKIVKTPVNPEKSYKTFSGVDITDGNERREVEKKAVEGLLGIFDLRIENTDNENIKSKLEMAQRTLSLKKETLENKDIPFNWNSHETYVEEFLNRLDKINRDESKSHDKKYLENLKNELKEVKNTSLFKYFANNYEATSNMFDEFQEGKINTHGFNKKSVGLYQERYRLSTIKERGEVLPDFRSKIEKKSDIPRSPAMYRS